MTLARLQLISLTTRRPWRGPLELQLHGRSRDGEETAHALLLTARDGAAQHLEDVAPLELDLSAGVVVLLVVPAHGGAHARVQGAASIHEKSLLRRRVAHDGVRAALAIETPTGKCELTYKVQFTDPLCAPAEHAPRDAASGRTRWPQLVGYAEGATASGERGLVDHGRLAVVDDAR